MRTALRRLKYTIATPLFIVASIVLSFANTQFAAAATLTWTGDGDGVTFSDGNNWSTDAVPTTGDDLVFPGVIILGGDVTLNNDLVGLSVTSIAAQAGGGSDNLLRINGNAITVSSSVSAAADTYFSLYTPITFSQNGTITDNASLYIDSLNVQDKTVTYNVTAPSCAYITTLFGSGTLNVNPGADNGLGLRNLNSFTGTVAASTGALIIDGTNATSSTATIATTGSGSVSLYAPSNSTWAANFNLSGTGWVAAQHGSYMGCAGSTPTETYTATLTGDVTLGSDISYRGTDNLTITGNYTPNGHTFIVQPGAGNVTTPQGTTTPPPVETEYDDEQPSSSEVVKNNETTTLDGTRGNVEVKEGGTLQGDGTSTSVLNNGTVAPGKTTGALTILETYTGHGTLQIGILNSTAYNQLKVGENYSGGGDAVVLSAGAELAVILRDGWSIKKNDQFTIVNNLSSTAISGTFDGLAEGAQFVVDGVTFSITYVGGDGNDIVLTALNTGSDPEAPNTGVAHLVLANPVVIAGFGIITAALLGALALRRTSNR